MNEDAKSAPTTWSVEEQVPLAPRTTLRLGGRAQCFARLTHQDEVAEAVRWASARGMQLTVLGGGSNVVVSDEGVAGLVVVMATRGTRYAREGERVLVTAEAGESWDELVASTVDQGLAGLECLSGIPGSVGATPIQNVGAYGQEVADTIREVRVLERTSGQTLSLRAEDCAFRYRESLFKRAPERYVVQSVSFALTEGGAPCVRYGELEKALAARKGIPSLREVRETVIALRRTKSMVLDPSDENGKSAGSFFENPIVSEREARVVEQHALSRSLIASASEMPSYPQSDGRVKLAAGWLIERSGIQKGLRRGAVGISSRHALALVHHGGGTSQALVDLAREVQERVHASFGVRLSPEPVFLGFAEPPLG